MVIQSPYQRLMISSLYWRAEIAHRGSTPPDVSNVEPKMIAITALNTFIVIAAVCIHYELLLRLNSLMPKLKAWHRFRVVVGVLGALTAHAVEVWIFALAYYFMIEAGNWGTLRGDFDGSLMDCVYFSFTTFTTLGFGDIEPVGVLKFLTGLEALTGLVLITWTASFLFIEMQKYWKTP